MILGEIKRYLRDGNSLRVSRSIRDTAYKVLKTREKLEEEDKEATIEKIAEAMQVQQKEVVYALDAISDPVSLFDPVYNKAGDTLMLMDQIYDEKNNDEVWTEHAALSEAMGHLGERDRHLAGAGLAAGKERHQRHPQRHRLRFVKISSPEKREAPVRENCGRALFRFFKSAHFPRR